MAGSQGSPEAGPIPLAFRQGVTMKRLSVVGLAILVLAACGGSDGESDGGSDGWPDADRAEFVRDRQEEGITRDEAACLADYFEERYDSYAAFLHTVTEDPEQVTEDGLAAVAACRFPEATTEETTTGLTTTGDGQFAEFEEEARDLLGEIQAEVLSQHGTFDVLPHLSDEEARDSWTQLTEIVAERSSDLYFRSAVRAVGKLRVELQRLREEVSD
jgi:pimeloyl-ACP methyl ester carboxylesterase